MEAVQGDDIMPKIEAPYEITSDIWVVSRGRWKKSLTLERLGGVVFVNLAVDEDEYEKYKPLAKKHNCNLVRLKCNGIAEARIKLVKLSDKKIIMLDDDLRFFKRVSNTDTSLVRTTPIQTRQMFEQLDKLLDEYSHASISARQGQNTVPYPLVFNTRYIRVLAYRTEDYNKCIHNRVQFMEDFDISLQLLRMGKQAAIMTDYSQDQYATQLPGGCSTYRNKDTHAKAAMALYELHKPFVKLREKKNKTGGEFGSRVEVTVYWKKAYESSFE